MVIKGNIKLYPYSFNVLQIHLFQNRESISKLYYFATYEENGALIEASPLEIQKPEDDHIKERAKERPELKDEEIAFAKPSELREIDSFFLLVKGVVYDVDEMKFAQAISNAYKTTLTAGAIDFSNVEVIISSRKTVIFEG